MTLIIKTAEDLAADARAARVAQLSAAVDAHVEARAKVMGYRGAAELVSYTASRVPDWAAEAQAFVAWRDTVWQAAVARIAKDAGLTPATLVAALPAWPDR